MKRANLCTSGESVLLEFHSFANELVAAAFSLVLITAYHLFLLRQLRRDPLYTVQAVNAQARSAWVESIMSGSDKGILAVQTLRNSTMASTFLASTAALSIIGALTLAEHGEKLAALNLFGSESSQLWQLKLLLLVGDFVAAFVCFSQAIRLFGHVGYMITLPAAGDARVLTPREVAIHLNRAGAAHTLGMRAYYFSVPLMFWLFGPFYMTIATLVLVPVLYRLDRSPRPDESRRDSLLQPSANKPGRARSS